MGQSDGFRGSSSSFHSSSSSLASLASSSSNGSLNMNGQSSSPQLQPHLSVSPPLIPPSNPPQYTDVVYGRHSRPENSNNTNPALIFPSQLETRQVLAGLNTRIEHSPSPSESQEGLMSSLSTPLPITAASIVSSGLTSHHQPLLAPNIARGSVSSTHSAASHASHTASSSKENTKIPSTAPGSSIKPRSKKKTTGPVHNARYKAKLCKNWAKNGSCPYFEKCQFAHGTHELEKWANRRARMKLATEAATAAVVVVSQDESMQESFSDHSEVSPVGQMDDLALQFSSHLQIPPNDIFNAHDSNLTTPSPVFDGTSIPVGPSPQDSFAQQKRLHFSSHVRGASFPQELLSQHNPQVQTSSYTDVAHHQEQVPFGDFQHSILKQDQQQQEPQRQQHQGDNQCIGQLFSMSTIFPSSFSYV